MNITVILCTFNRCESLEKALESMARSVVPDAIDWEVLVVDNNSSDRTPDVVRSFCQRYPGRFRYLFEPQPGKSRALNAGVRESRGTILAFTDDDVVVDPKWLHSLTAPLYDGEWVGAGGRVLPEETFSLPPWIAPQDRNGLGPLAVFNPDREAGALTEAPFGVNMAFQKRVFEQYGGFRIDLGPLPGNARPQKNEDSEFCIRLLSAGERLRYEPSAIVYHSIPPNRATKGYFLAWWFDKARADIRAFGIPSDPQWFVAGIPLYMFRRLAVWTLRWMVAVRPARRFSCKINAWMSIGQIKECYDLSHEAKDRNAAPHRQSRRNSPHP